MGRVVMRRMQREGTILSGFSVFLSPALASSRAEVLPIGLNSLQAELSMERERRR